MPLFFDDKSPRAKKEGELEDEPIEVDEIEEEYIQLDDTDEYSSEYDSEPDFSNGADEYSSEYDSEPDFSDDGDEYEVADLLAKAEKKYNVFSNTDGVEKETLERIGIKSEEENPIPKSRLAEEFNRSPQEYIQPGLHQRGPKPIITKAEASSRKQGKAKEVFMVFAVKVMPIILVVGISAALMGGLLYATYSLISR